MNSQLLIRLTHTVTIERSISMICIPDRDTAECELTKLRYQHGLRLLKAIIRKDRPGRSDTSRTYTLRYTIRETETRSRAKPLLGNNAALFFLRCRFGHPDCSHVEEASSY
jgi:hypothetical protein